MRVFLILFLLGLNLIAEDRSDFWKKAERKDAQVRHYFDIDKAFSDTLDTSRHPEISTIFEEAVQRAKTDPISVWALGSILDYHGEKLSEGQTTALFNSAVASTANEQGTARQSAYATLEEFDSAFLDQYFATEAGATKRSQLLRNLKIAIERSTGMEYWDAVHLLYSKKFKFTEDDVFRSEHLKKHLGSLFSGLDTDSKRRNLTALTILYPRLTVDEKEQCKNTALNYAEERTFDNALFAREVIELGAKK